MAPARTLVLAHDGACSVPPVHGVLRRAHTKSISVIGFPRHRVDIGREGTRLAIVPQEPHQPVRRRQRQGPLGRRLLGARHRNGRSGETRFFVV